MPFNLAFPFHTRDGREAELVEKWPKTLPPLDVCANPPPGTPSFYECIQAHVKFRGSPHGGLYCFTKDGRSFDPYDRSLDLINVEDKP